MVINTIQYAADTATLSNNIGLQVAVNFCQ